MDTLASLLRALIGIAGLIALYWSISEDRKRINWKLVVSALCLHVALAFLVLKVGVIHSAVEGVSIFFGVSSVLAMRGAHDLRKMPDQVPIFGMAFTVFPTIIFFSAFSAVLYHLRILQWFVFGFAWLLSKALKVSGAECLAAAANVFIGQAEATKRRRSHLESTCQRHRF